MRDRKLALMICATILTSGGANAQSKDQFDLVCTGTMQDALKNTEKPWEMHISVDLKVGQFAILGAKAPSNIRRIEPGRIYFYDEPPSVAFDTDKLSVSRADGSISQMLSGHIAPFLDVGKGQCTTAPFTPLPKTMF